MSKKVLLVAGHGAGDLGAIAGNRQESTETRRLAQALYDALKTMNVDVTLYNVNKDLYRTSDHANYKEYDEVVEIHLNAFTSAAANGQEILIKTGFEADALDRQLLQVGAKYWANRGLKYRSDLANMNIFASLGVSYRIIETCFITSPRDMSILEHHFDAYIKDMANTIQASAGTKTAVTQPSVTNPEYTVGSTTYKIGDTVRFSSCYKSSTDTIDKHIKASQMLRDTGTITKIIANARNPYLLDNGLCWVNDGDIREILR